MESIVPYISIFVPIFIAATTALLAKKKNRSVGLWLFFGFVGGFIALIILVMLPEIKNDTKSKSTSPPLPPDDKKKKTLMQDSVFDIISKEFQAMNKGKFNSNVKKGTTQTPPTFISDQQKTGKHCPKCKQYYDGFPENCPFCGKGLKH